MSLQISNTLFREKNTTSALQKTEPGKMCTAITNLSPLQRDTVSFGAKHKMLTASKLKKLIEKAGWYLANQKGSHGQFRHPEKFGKVTIPFSKGGISRNIIMSVLRQAGLPKAALL